MLMKAGFALSHSSKFDLIIEYFIKKENYNIFEINANIRPKRHVIVGDYLKRIKHG